MGGYLVAEGAEGKGCCVASWAKEAKASETIRSATQLARMSVFNYSCYGLASFCRKAASSGGGGTENESGFPVRGCDNSTAAA